MIISILWRSTWVTWKRYKATWILCDVGPTVCRIVLFFDSDWCMYGYRNLIDSRDMDSKFCSITSRLSERLGCFSSNKLWFTIGCGWNVSVLTSLVAPWLTFENTVSVACEALPTFCLSIIKAGTRTMNRCQWDSKGFFLYSLVLSRPWLVDG